MGVQRAGVVRDVATVALLVALGQALVQALGVVSSGLVRYPGRWEPTLGADTGVYLSAAADLPTVEADSVTKLIYIVLIRIDAALGLAGWGLVMVQVALLFVAGLLLLRLVQAEFGRRAAVLSVAVLTLNPQVTQWTKVLLIEAVFMPMMVIVMVVLARSAGEPSLRPLALVLGGLTVLIRPNGIGALLGVIAFLALRRERLRWSVLALGSIAIMVVVVLTPAFQIPGGEENTVAARTYEGLVVWVDPEFVRLDMPPADDPSDLSNVAVVRYAVSHPFATMRLALSRVVMELVQVRAHYPITANVIIAAQMAVVFMLATIGGARLRGSPLNASILWVTAGLLLVVAGTWSIAEGRFGWAAMVTWSPWLGIGADTIIRRVRGARPAGPVPQPG